MGKVVKFLLPVFAAVVGVVGTAGATMAAETDYQKYYGEAMESLAGIDMSKALQLERKAVGEQFPEFDAYKDVPFGIKQIETLYPYDGSEGDHDIFGSYGGVFLGKSALILLIANVDPETDPNWETNSTVMSLQSKNSTELLQMAKSDARYASDVDYKKEVDVFQVTYDRGVRILRRDLPKLGATITDAMTAEQLVAVAKALPEYTKFGNKDDGPNAKNLYAAYANARQSMNCYEAEECANGGFADSMAK